MKPVIRYTVEIHKNSRRAQRKGLTTAYDKDGKPYPKDHFSKQVIRAHDGDPLPHDYLPCVVRGFRSKYERHIGEKQKARLP